MKTCLVVDDVKMSRYTSGLYLNELGFEMIEAQNGEETIDLIKRKPVDAILLDWHLKKEDGLELMKEIRETENGKSARIIIFSGVEGEDKKSEAISAGADGFILKPTKKDKLESIFRRNGLLS